MRDFSFEKLVAYQKAKRLAVEVYRLSEVFPESEKFALSSQIRRAITSVTANLAEGCGRKNLREKKYFISIAFGSLMESYSQLDIAKELGYITEDDLNNIKISFIDCSRLINALSKSLESSPINQ